VGEQCHFETFEIKDSFNNSSYIFKKDRGRLQRAALHPGLWVVDGMKKQGLHWHNNSVQKVERQPVCAGAAPSQPTTWRFQHGASPHNGRQAQECFPKIHDHLLFEHTGLALSSGANLTARLARDKLLP
jgi:hypothetical protein